MTDPKLEQQTRELLAQSLDERGYPTEANNVRRGDDLESYEGELHALRHALAALSQQRAVAEGFLAHVASVCRGAVEFCEAKPQRTPEDDREYNGTIWDHAAKLQAEIEALRALLLEACDDGDEADADLLATLERARTAEAKAERLAEALRDALECGNDGDWQSARQYITAALRDHDQEGKDG